MKQKLGKLPNPIKNHRISIITSDHQRQSTESI